MSSPLNFRPANAHSAQVRMHLEVSGTSLPIAQLGPDFLILEQTVHHPATHGEIVLQIDASKSRWKVTLPDGLAAAGQRTAING
ncbi:MAG TPA: hypothetical protein VGM64_00305 [Lacunisphaera sp.]|jgi:hypothetical protein